MPPLDDQTRILLEKLDQHLRAMEKIRSLSGFVLGLRGEIESLILSSEKMTREEIQSRYSEIRERVLNIRTSLMDQRLKTPKG